MTISKSLCTRIRAASLNISKDRSSHRYLILEIWPILTLLHTKKRGNILGKSTANFAIHLSLFFADWICLFPGKLASHNSMRKNDKVGNKTDFYFKEVKEIKYSEKDRSPLIRKKQNYSHPHSNWWKMQSFRHSLAVDRHQRVKIKVCRHRK